MMQGRGAWTRALLLGALLALLTTTTTGQKVDCSSDEKGALFAKGRRDANRFAIKVWKNRCPEASQFESLLIASTPTKGPKFSACYVKGYEKGVDTFVKSLSRKCPGEGSCFKDGVRVGDYGARIFCNLPSNAAIPSSVGCVEASQEQCKYAFDDVVAANCPGKAGALPFRNAYCAMEPQADSYLPDNRRRLRSA